MIANRYSRCRDFMYRQRLHLTGVTPGSDAWDALDDRDVRKLAALAALGLGSVLNQEIAQLARVRAEKDAAVAVAGAKDWAGVARTLRRRDEARRSSAYVERVTG